MNFNQAKIISVYYNKGDRKPYDVNGKPIAYIGEEFIGSTEATTIRFYLGEDIDSSTATIVTKRADGERRLDICSKVGTGATSYYEVTLNEWYSAVKGKLVVVFKAYNGSVTFDDNENPTEILSVSGRIVVSDIFNLDIAYAPVADLVVPADATEPYEDWFFALSTKLDKADSITVAGALPTLTGGAYDDRYFYIENEGTGRLYYINGSTAEEVVWQVGTLKLTATGNGELTADTGKLSFDASYGGVKFDLYNNVFGHLGQDLHYYGKASVAITKGQVVQFAGVQGDHYLIKPAVQSEINANPKLIMGLALQDIDLNNFGYVSAFGRLIGVDTVASGFAVGDLLWFNSSGVVAGALTKTQPTGTNAKVLLAVVVKEETGSSNNGVLLVRPTIEPKLDELQNVLLSGQANGDVLSYDGTKWINSNRLTTAETDISNIEDGTTIVAKANADKDGNEFDATYLKKATATSTYVPLSSKGVANGVAPLGSDNKIPSIHLPGGVDDIKEFADLASFPLVGEASIIYVALDTNKIYRWGGSAYVEISSSLALGETSSTAFAGDRGVALETLTDNIVDGTQTLTDTTITNSDIAIPPLIVNAISGTTSTLQSLRINNTQVSRIDATGAYRVNSGIYNLTLNNARVDTGNNGVSISRNVNDTNPALIVNKNQGTGNILQVQSAGANKLEIDVNGWLYQNGTRLFHQTGGTTNTFFGQLSGNTSVSGTLNTGIGYEALESITTGSNNTTIGRRGLRNLTTGDENTSLGVSAGRTITSGSQNTFIGWEAGFNASQLSTATNSTGIGYQAYTDKSNQMVFGNSSVSEFVFNRNASGLVLMPNTEIGKIDTPNTLNVRGSVLLNTMPGIDQVGTITLGRYDNNTNRFSTITSLVSATTGSNYLRFNVHNGTVSSTTNVMTLLGDGKVGIGTTSPSHKLHVVGSGFFTGDTSVPNGPADLGFYLGKSLTNEDRRLEIVSPSTGFSYIDFTQPNTDALGRIIYSNTNNTMDFFTNIPSSGFSNPRMRIDEKGLVGINETSPSAQLQVKSGATTRVPLVVDTLASQTANLAEYKLNGSNKFIINKDGGVSLIEAYSSAGYSNALIGFYSTGTNISRNVADTNPALIVNLANASATGNIQVWQKSGSAKAYITNSGGIELRDRVVVEEPTAQEAFYLFDSVEDLFYVESADGDVYNKNGTYGTISDVRLKENIVQARDYTEDLMKLNVVKYSFKKDHSETPTHLGFIAQEVEEVFPGLVETKKTKELDDQKQIKMSVLIPMLVKTIQEQQKQIDELKAKIG